MLDEDEVVRQLMSMLGNKKQLQIRSTSGRLIKLSVDELMEADDCNV
jgi:hypothetical protein